MRLQNPELLAVELECALGEVHWPSEGIASDMRLRTMGVCGLVSVGLALKFDHATTILSKPQIEAQPGMRHVFIRLSQEGTKFIFDASYTQFLEYAGLTSGYVKHGGADTFPDEKIAVFKQDDQAEIVDQLTRHARHALDTYVAPDDRYYNSRRVFEHFSDDRIRQNYMEIWNPAHFSQFHCSDIEKIKAKKLASMISDDAVVLID
jgi:hypothetical protein